MIVRRPKILILGAGSFFTNFWIRDIALTPGIEGGSFALVDIDPERLQLACDMAKRILQELGKEEVWEVKASLDRKELMPKTDYLINTIEVAGTDTVRYDYEIPKNTELINALGIPLVQVE